MSRPFYPITIQLGLDHHYAVMNHLETSNVCAVMIFDLVMPSLRRFDNLNLVHWDLRG